MNQLYSPWALLLLLLVPVVVWLMVRKGRSAGLKFSSVEGIKSSKVSWRVKSRWVLVLFRVLCLILLITALARPRYGMKKTVISTEGVAIQLVVDCSGSMAEETDFFGEKTNKLEAVKRIVSDFIEGDGKDLKGRAGDLIGLITYATYPETLCPLVHSHHLLVDFLKRAEPIQHRQLGNTAIGDALALAAARLNQAETEIKNQSKFKAGDIDDSDGGGSEDSFEIKSKVIILLTDGKQNAGDYSPLQAAELAKKWGIKIYAIGMASEVYQQTFFGPQKIPVSAQIDERLLRSVANSTGGRYFQAGDAKTLKEIYKTIDELEKSKVESVEYMEFAERFAVFAAAALGLLLMEIFSSTTFLRKIP